MIFKNLPPPSYERYSDLDEVTRNIRQQQYPMGKEWKKMCQYLKVPMPRQGQQVACA
jgi:hypothetical protein